jgi:ribosomal protein S18 acetylase RimI-like enzyme
MITIDKLALDDLAGLKLLYESGFEASASDSDRMAEVFNQIKDNSNYIILCAKMSDQVVGSVMGVVCNELFGKCLPFMVVENVIVLHEYRRLGIAKQLMRSLEEQAMMNKCSTILFVSSEHRAGAHKLYESMGYGADKVNGYRKRLKY